MGLIDRFGEGAKRAAKLAVPGAALMDIARRPDCELRDYAEQRGLTYHGQQAPAGFTSATGILQQSIDEIFNTMEGVLPGGRYGIAFHAFEREDEHYGFQHRRMNHGMTKVAVVVPSGLGSIQRMLLRAYEIEDHDLPVGFALVPPDRYGIQGRHLYFGANADRPAIDAVLHAASPWLASADSAGPFDAPDLAYSYGLLWLVTKGYLEDAKLDAACEALCSIGDELEQASTGLHPARSFTDTLEGPCWANVEEGRAPQPSNPVEIPGAQGLESAPGPGWLSVWKQTIDLMPAMNVVEDSKQFHQAFPWLPAPGQAIFVFGGKLPGSDVNGRFALLADRAHENPMGMTLNSGLNIVMMEVKDGASTKEPFEYGTNLQVAIREGVATFWQPRLDVTGDPLAGVSEFITGALAHAKERGWIAAPA